MNIPSSQFNNPGFGGFQCPISKRQFPAQDDSKTATNDAMQAQQNHTYEIVYALTQKFGHKLTVEEMRRLYEQGEADGQK